MAETITEAVTELRDELADYIEAAYHIREPGLLRQRRRLLEEPGVISQVPFVEALPQYELAGEGALDAALQQHPGAREAFNRLKGSAPDPDDLPSDHAAYEEHKEDIELGPRVYDPPYTHQLKSVERALGGGSFVVTTGTGSGKTECFTLPLLAHLAQQAWQAHHQETPAKWATRAVRAIVLYPMNALVNDQLARMRLLFGDPRLVQLVNSDWATATDDGQPSWRPILFGRYTGRALYPGVRRRLDTHPDGTPKRYTNGRLKRHYKFKGRDKNRLDPAGGGCAAEGRKTVRTFFLEHEKAAKAAIEQLRAPDGAPLNEEQQRSLNLWRKLRRQGKWPAKRDLGSWFWGPMGESPSGRRQWFKLENPPPDGSEDVAVRAVRLSRDAELFTRHEAQAEPPDVLITNYSMLEYMLMRPLERGIFEQTREWLARHDERLILVIDEAHLYRGTGGAEVALLIRRLCQRLGIGPDRLQVMMTSASFEGDTAAKAFAAELTGKEDDDFEVIKSALVLGESADQEPEDVGEVVQILAEINHGVVVSAPGSDEAAATLRPLFDHLGTEPSDLSIPRQLHNALSTWAPIHRLRRCATPGAGEVDGDLDEQGRPRMAGARPVTTLPLGHRYKGKPLTRLVFGDAPEGAPDLRERALTTLLSLATVARSERGAPLLPARAHVFFRGLPGLWICMNPACGEIEEEERSSIGGKLYAADPGPHCACGARVFPLYTCRDCGTAYARAYADIKDRDYRQHGPAALEGERAFLWSEPGRPPRRAADEDGGGTLRTALAPVDLLLGLEDNERLQIVGAGDVVLRLLDINSGRLEQGTWHTWEPVPAGKRPVALPPKPSTGAGEATGCRPSQQRRCPVCNQEAPFGRSTVMDHITKGDDPFAALVKRQLAIQPQRSAPTPFAPLGGRKVLVFSDSRQRAAGLAIKLNEFVAQDALRPVLMEGWSALVRTMGQGAKLQHVPNCAYTLGTKRLGDIELRFPEREDEVGTIREFRALQEALYDVLPDGDGDEIKEVLEDNGDAIPPESLSAAIYAALTGKRANLRDAFEVQLGVVRGNRARAVNLETLALARLVTGRTNQQLSRAGLPSTESLCPDQNGDCPICRRAMVDLWVQHAARAYKVEVRGLMREGWNTGEQVPTGLPPNAAIHAALSRMIPAGVLQPLHRASRALQVKQATGALIGNRLRLNHQGWGSPEGSVPVWGMCSRCSTVQPLFPPLHQDEVSAATQRRCAQCGEGGPEGDRTVQPLDLTLDVQHKLARRHDDYMVAWFDARRGWYRHAAVLALAEQTPPLVPVAAEHTAAIGDAPAGEIFSPAEHHEVLFQDIDVGTDHRGRVRKAVDILSSTTTMEVGIDIGSLLGVALRNMPPRRDNYQQRAGRSGRRGDGVATVIAYANTGSHDTFGYTQPGAMLNAPVQNPKLSKGNEKVALRHANAFLLQRWAHEVTGQLNEWEQPQLFEALGTVGSFIRPSAKLNLFALERWAGEQTGAVINTAVSCAGALLEDDGKEHLRERLPTGLVEAVREVVLAHSASRSGRSGADVARHLLALTRYQIRPILTALGATYERSWIELKDTVRPMQLATGEKNSDHRWNVAKAVIAMRNTDGGVVVVGARERDDGSVGPSPEGRSGEYRGLGTKDLDKWWRDNSATFLGPDPSWSRTKGTNRERIKWHPEQVDMRRFVTPALGWLDGAPIALLFVERQETQRRPEGEGWRLRSLLTVQVAGQGGAVPRIAFVRQRGEVGMQLRVLETDTQFIAHQDEYGTPDPLLSPTLEDLSATLLELNDAPAPNLAELPTGLIPGVEEQADEDPEEGTDEHPDNPEGEGPQENPVEGWEPAAEPAEPEPEPTDEQDDDVGDDQEDLEDSTAVHTSGFRAAGRRKDNDTDLLPLLINAGVLPSYAFPTDVVSFHVLARDERSREARVLYQPSLGLEQALSQYAPGRQVKLDGDVRFVGALFDLSPGQRDRRRAYKDRSAYFHCGSCGHLTTRLDGQELTVDDFKRDRAPQGSGTEPSPQRKRTCEICGAQEPLRLWMKPTGFAHVRPEQGAQQLPALAYPTAAKLVVPAAPDDVARSDAWDGRVRTTLDWTEQLFWVNEASERWGYAYCTSCGRIEPAHGHRSGWRTGAHAKPWELFGPGKQGEEQQCEAGLVRTGLALGHWSRTDVALIELRVEEAGLRLLPNDVRAQAALRTLSEALVIGAALLVDAPETELGCGFRPVAGASGERVELYLYDKVAGGAGHAHTAAAQLCELLAAARHVLNNLCGCTRTCYDCVRRYSNQLDHALLDRHLATFVLDTLRDGEPPKTWAPVGHERAVAAIAQDVHRRLQSTSPDAWQVERDYTLEVEPIEGNGGTRNVSVPAALIGPDQRVVALAVAFPFEPGEPLSEAPSPQYASRTLDECLPVGDHVSVVPVNPFDAFVDVPGCASGVWDMEFGG